MNNILPTRLALALLLCTAALPAAALTSKPKMAARIETPEMRVQHLHDQLGITQDEEVQWTAVAQVMLDNAVAINTAVQDRLHMAGSMTAVSDLKSYEAIVDAHADGINKLAVAFAPLYAAMPMAQQKQADMVFARRTAPSRLKTHA